MADKLDIFAVLGYFDEGNMEVHQALREDPGMLKELEKALPWVLPQWMTGATQDAAHAELVDNFNLMCNEGWFDLYGHTELQAKLLAACGTGRKVRHKFFKPTKAKNLQKMTEFLGHKYQDIREEEVELWCHLNDATSVTDLAASLGFQPKEVTELTKAYESLRKG